MFHPPPISARVDPLQGSLYSVLAQRMRGYRGRRYPLHIGDTSVSPPEPAHFEAVQPERLGNPYRYGATAGEPELRAAIAERMRGVHGLGWAGAEDVLVTVGATHAVFCAVQATTNPGDEGILVTPRWPLVRGACVLSGVTPVEVPLVQEMLDDPEIDPASVLEPHITDRTRFIYLINPANPSGFVYERRHLESIGALAAERGLWVIADEAYASHAWARPHVAALSVPTLMHRTISTYTFSKLFALAGARVGWAMGPPRAIDAMRKVATYSTYNPPQIGQVAALAALETGEAFVTHTREAYQQAATLVAERLDARFHPAQGGVFVFVDLRELGPDVMPALEAFADRGVTLAPGATFGPGFEGWARLCYTAIPQPHLEEAIDQINETLRELRARG